eukprot:7226719-Prymnesium_polylepis.1
MPFFSCLRLRRSNCAGGLSLVRCSRACACVGAILRLRRGSRFVEERECAHALQRPAEHAVDRQVRHPWPSFPCANSGEAAAQQAARAVAHARTLVALAREMLADVGGGDVFRCVRLLLTELAAALH